MEVKRRQTEKVVKNRHTSIATDYNAGLPVKEIAEKHGVSVATVYYALKKVVSYKEDKK